MRRIAVAAIALQIRPTSFDLVLGHEDVGGSLAQVDADRSPERSSARPPPMAASGEALRMEGEPDVPDWRPSPMQGSEWMPLFSR